MATGLGKVRRFSAEEERVETGPIMFGDDWPGIFIRGDEAFMYTMALREITYDDQPVISFIAKRVLLGLLDALQSSDCQNNDAFPAWHKDTHDQR